MADVTETRHGPLPKNQAPGVLGLVVVFTEGVEPELRAEAVTGRMRIGRDTSAELCLEDGQASRLHAEVLPSRGGLLVTDLGSRNGTFVDGRRITAPEVPAAVGQSLRCGKTLLRVVADVTPFQALTANPGVSTLLGGPRIAAIRRSIERMGPLTEPVLIEGETGTGKEKIAEALHAASGRRGELIAVNCAAIPGELVESELFGHSRGAFSGSDRSRQGLFRAADGGTLLLDELGDLPLDIQAKLLRVLEGGEVRPVGEDRAQRVDVRVVAATNLSLDEMVAEGRFRADLLHRIAAWRIRVPALRERPEDVALLASHFLPNRLVRFTVEAMEALITGSWSGNVRELRNVVRTAAARAATDGGKITVEHLPPELGSRAEREPDASGPLSTELEDAVLRARIETALSLREGNVAQVARDLGFGRPWLYQTLKRFGIDPDSFRKR
ncbi:MAG: sigma 54-interacting transcriptional regulator [Myxococcales bacterium]|nr:sigma 54-interacting transcriptional regulator [Myxococcales bacterium]